MDKKGKSGESGCVDILTFYKYLQSILSKQENIFMTESCCGDV